MRIPFIAGNWKMFKTVHDTVVYVKEFRSVVKDIEDVEIVLAPPFTAIHAAAEAARNSNVGISGQDLHWEREGAFTGEVSARMIKDAGATYVIVGHSERRRVMGESNDLVGRKLARALDQGLVPILCVGETIAERQAKRTLGVVLEQLDAALRELTESKAAPLLVAYEPVWAIGTGVNATAEQVEEMHRVVRDALVKRFTPAFADRTRILYGGSVKPENAAELLAVEGVDGVLVGGASLSAASFLAIIDACPDRARARGLRS